jgi:polysaccharide deacetylase family protein (PEP-CTERM system associated)
MKCPFVRLSQPSGADCSEHAMKNALTIDLEDYYHVSAFREYVRQEDWHSRPSRILQNTELLLDCLDAAGCRATFFTLGWVAESHPQIVRHVADRGHEIACHSLRHRTVYEMSPAEFREDTSRAKKILEDSSGKQILGYRAPSFSITEKSFWAFDVLCELGFVYDSSVFPVRHLNYGTETASRKPFRIETASGPLFEFPMTTIEIAGLRSPLGGGAYFRLLPYWYTRWGIRYLNLSESMPVCVYLHPWELDPEQPRMSGNLTARLRHYFGLSRTLMKFRQLLKDFEFVPLYEISTAEWAIQPRETASVK